MWALEEEEDIQELSEPVRDKKERCVQNKLAKEKSVQNMPLSDVMVDGHGRKPKQSKAKVNNHEPPTGSKCGGVKSMLATPDAEDDDNCDLVSTRHKSPMKGGY